jgi:hypothetical protein
MGLSLFDLCLPLGGELAGESCPQGLKLLFTDRPDAGGFDFGAHAELVGVIIAEPILAANHGQDLHFLLSVSVLGFVLLLCGLALSKSLLHLQQIHSQGLVLLLQVVESRLEMPMLVAPQSRLASFRPNYHVIKIIQKSGL